MPLLKRKAGQASIRFKTRESAKKSGTFRSLAAMGQKPIVVKGGLSKEERKIRKQFPKTPSPAKRFPFRIVSLKPKATKKLTKSKIRSLFS